MTPLSDSGTCKDYPKIVYQFKTVSWLRLQIDIHYLLILKDKVKLGLLKNMQMICKKEDRYQILTILNSRIGSWNIVFKMEKHLLFKVLKIKSTRLLIRFLKNRLYGKRQEDSLRLVVKIWISIRTSKCLWLVDCQIHHFHLNWVPKQPSSILQLLKEVLNNNY